MKCTKHIIVSSSFTSHFTFKEIINTDKEYVCLLNIFVIIVFLNCFFFLFKLCIFVIFFYWAPCCVDLSFLIWTSALKPRFVLIRKCVSKIYLVFLLSISGHSIFVYYRNAIRALHSHLSPHSFMFNSKLTSSELYFLTTHCWFCVIVQFVRWIDSFCKNGPCSTPVYVDVKYEKPEVFV